MNTLLTLTPAIYVPGNRSYTFFIKGILPGRIRSGCYPISRQFRMFKVTSVRRGDFLPTQANESILFEEACSMFFR